MKKSILNVILTAFLYQVCFYQSVHAQNINGVVIEVSQSALSSFIFNGTVTNFKFEENEAYGYYAVQNLGSNTVTITARKSTKNTYFFMVAEGKRTHKFQIVYKDNIDPAETDHDYSNLKELQKLINRQATKPRPVNNPVETSAEPGPAVEKPKPEQPVPGPSTEPVNQYSNPPETEPYSQLVTRANNTYRDRKWEEAKALYSKAHVLQPNDGWVTGQLKKIDANLNASKTSAIEDGKRKSFQSYIDIGDGDLLQKDYDGAIDAFKKALEVIPNDAVTLAKIKDAETKQKQAAAQKDLDVQNAERAKKEKEFSDLVKAGDNAFNQKTYDVASNRYNLSMSIKPNDPYVVSRLKEIEKKMADAEKLKKDSADYVTFQSYMAIADEDFKNNAFDDARTAYKEALKHKQGDPVALKQLAKIDAAETEYKAKLEKQRIDKEQQDKYNTAITLANNASEAGEYAIASEQYTIASKIKPGEALPLQKLKETKDLIAKQKETTLARIKDSTTTSNYNAAIGKAEQALEIKDYKNAIASYQFAGSLKPNETYPKQKIEEINATIKAVNDSIAVVKKRDNDFKVAMEKGNAALKYNQLETAKKAFEVASNLKPDNGDAQGKLAKVTAQIEEIARQKKIDEDYEQAMHNGDSLAATSGTLNESRVWYKKAAELKPELGLAKKQITYVEKVLGIDTASVRAKRKDSALNVEKSKFRLANAAFNRGNDQITRRDYEGALASYNEFLNTTYDTSIYNPYVIYNKQYDLARGKLDGLKALVEKNRKPEPVVVAPPEENKKKKKRKAKQEEPKPVPADNAKESTVIYFPNQKDIDTKGLKAKYPDIDFTAAPVDQQFNKQEYSRQNNKDIQAIVEEKPRLSINTSADGIKLSCIGIDFKGDNAFFKFNIQNDASSEFLTGPMILSRNGTEGRSINLFPIYISEFPVVMTGKEKTFVYVTNAITDMATDETFVFQLNDRLKKIKTSVTIPGDVYNKEKQH